MKSRARSPISFKGPRDATFAEVWHYSPHHPTIPGHVSVFRYKSRESWRRGINPLWVKRYGEEITIPRTREPENPRATLQYFAYKDEEGIWRHDANVQTISARRGEPVKALMPGAGRDPPRYDPRW